MDNTQNTPRRLIDSSNVVVWAWDSTAFGVALPSVQIVRFNLRFLGQSYDEITKWALLNNHAYMI